MSTTPYTDNGKLDLSGPVTGMQLILEEYALQFVDTMRHVKIAEIRHEKEIAARSGVPADRTSNIAQLAAEIGLCPIVMTAGFEHVNIGVVAVDDFAKKLEKSSFKLNMQLAQTSIPGHVIYKGGGQGPNMNVQDLVAAREAIVEKFEASPFSEGPMTSEGLKIAAVELYQESLAQSETKRNQGLEVFLNNRWSSSNEAANKPVWTPSQKAG